MVYVSVVFLWLGVILWCTDNRATAVAIWIGLAIGITGVAGIEIGRSI